MMLQILLHHLFRDVARAPGSVTDGPEVSTAVSILFHSAALLTFREVCSN